jgi:hypothetical protein
VAIANHRSYYPARVALLSPEGQVLREYWHSGHLYAFTAADLNGGGEETIYLGGIANGYDSAVLVALDPNTMDGASREESPRHQLQGLDPPREKARILLPHSRLAEGLYRYNGVTVLAAQQRALTVATWDTVRDGHESPGLLYTFDPNLRCSGVTLADNFYSAYRALGRPGPLTPQDFAAMRNVRYLTGP